MFSVGRWRVRPELKRIESGSDVRELEPKVMDLLVLLAAEPGAVISREHLRTTLWDGVAVGDDAIARCVFKLRKALGDDSEAPVFVETVAKRGYRLIAPVRRNAVKRATWIKGFGALAAAGVALVLLVGFYLAPNSEKNSEILVERAKDAYSQYTRGGNESAAALYIRVLEDDPQNREALAGLAMVEVQRAVRWSDGDETRAATLGAALADGRLHNAKARAALDRAERLLARTPSGARDTVSVLQAQGLLRSARGDLSGAAQAYRRALGRDPTAFGAMINLADVSSLQHDERSALHWLEKAYTQLSTSYTTEVRRLGPWLAPLGIEIARRRAALGEHTHAQAWLRRTLADTGDISVREAMERMQHSNTSGEKHTRM